MKEYKADITEVTTKHKIERVGYFDDEDGYIEPYTVEREEIKRIIEITLPDTELLHNITIGDQDYGLYQVQINSKANKLKIIIKSYPKPISLIS